MTYTSTAGRVSPSFTSGRVWDEVEKAQPKTRLRSKTQGARLSLARIGSYYWVKITTRLRLTFRFVREHLFARWWHMQSVIVARERVANCGRRSHQHIE